jgi:hypothetical protein
LHIPGDVIDDISQNGGNGFENKFWSVVRTWATSDPVLVSVDNFMEALATLHRDVALGQYTSETES